MAHKKYGVKPPEWWKHLRFMKRPTEKRTRKDGKRKIQAELAERKIKDLE